jgi:hypothetical protein
MKTPPQGDIAAGILLALMVTVIAVICVVLAAAGG